MDVEPGAGVVIAERYLVEFAEMAQRMNRLNDVEETLRAVLAEAQAAELGDAVGLLLVQGRLITSAAASDPEVERADRLQLECGEGPGVEAILRRRGFVAPDLRVNEQWRSWAPQAVRMGWVSVLTVGLADGETFGALNVYSRRPGQFDEQRAAVARAFAAHASLAVSNARERHSLRQAIDARNLIGQAQGILMERYSLDAEKSFDVLRRYSSHGNRKLREVASDLVRSRRLPEASWREREL
jgi:GAF domain-containing protein